MSLINDALKDLDQRENLEKQFKPAPNGLANEKAGKNAYRKVYAAVFCLGLGALGGWLLPKYSTTYDQQHLQTIETASTDNERSNIDVTTEGERLRFVRVVEKDTQEDSGAIQKATLRSSGQFDEQIFEQVESAAPADVPPELGNTQNQDSVIDALLLLANKALEEDRLTRPSDANAFSYYQKVLRVDTNNTDALLGIDQIIRRYEELISIAIADKNVSRANQFASRLKRVGVDKIRLQNMLARIDQLTLDTEATQPLTANKSLETVSASRNEYVSDGDSLDKNAQEAKKIPSEGQGTHEHFLMARSEVQKEIDVLQTADSLVGKGRKADAVALLQEYVSTVENSQHVDVVLFSYYLDSNREYEARALVRGINSPHSYLSYMRSKLDVLDGNISLALNRLENTPPDEQAKIRHFTLQAGLYQHVEAYEKSRNLYSKLLTFDSQNPVYLLGYAVSSDKLNDVNQAYIGYKRLHDTNKLKPDVEIFVTNRLKQLAKNENVSNIAESNAW